MQTYISYTFCLAEKHKNLNENQCEINSSTGLSLVLQAAKWLFEEYLASSNYTAPHV